MSKVINITPTWSGMLPMYLAVIRNSESTKSIRAAESELRRMADLADRYNAMLENDRKAALATREAAP